MRVVLSEDPAIGHWWEDKPIRDYLTKSFTHTYVTNWSEVTHEQRERMWQYFQDTVRVDKEGYPLRTEWESQVKRRISQCIGNDVIAKNKLDCLCVTHWERLKKRPVENPEFAKTSETNKGPEATPYQLMEKSKKDKHGNWINPRAEQTDVGYHRLMNQPMPRGVRPDPYESYYKAAGGFDEKLCVWGTGSATPELYDPPANRIGRHLVSSYSPSLLSRVTMENIQLRGKIGRMDMQMMTQKHKGDSMDAFLAKKFGWTPPPPTCSGGPPPFGRDEFTDDGVGVGMNRIVDWFPLCGRL